MEPWFAATIFKTASILYKIIDLRSRASKRRTFGSVLAVSIREGMGRTFRVKSLHIRYPLVEGVQHVRVSRMQLIPGRLLFRRKLIPDRMTCLMGRGLPHI